MLEFLKLTLQIESYASDRVVRLNKNIIFQHNSSSYSNSGNKGTNDAPSDSDEFSEEVIYSQESPQMGDVITDYDWDLDRFVEIKSPFTKKKKYYHRVIILLIGIGIKIIPL